MEKEKYGKGLPHQVYLMGVDNLIMENNFTYQCCVQTLEEITNLNKKLCGEMIDSIGSCSSEIVSNTDTWKSKESHQRVLN